MKTGSTKPVTPCCCPFFCVILEEMGQAWERLERSSDEIWSLPAPHTPLAEGLRGLGSGNYHFPRSIRKYSLVDVQVLIIIITVLLKIFKMCCFPVSLTSVCLRIIIIIIYFFLSNLVKCLGVWQDKQSQSSFLSSNSQIYSKNCCNMNKTPKFKIDAWKIHLCRFMFNEILTCLTLLKRTDLELCHSTFAILHWLFRDIFACENMPSGAVI